MHGRGVPYLAALLATAIGLDGGSTGNAAQEYTARVDLVRVSVGIHDPEGGDAPRLLPADFEVYDNEVRQRVDFVLEPLTRLDLALVIDKSGSMRDQWPVTAAAAEQFLQALRPQDCAFVLSFSDRVEAAVWGKADHDWRAFLDAITVTGGTRLYDALMFGLRTFELSDMPPASATRPPEPTSSDLSFVREPTVPNTRASLVTELHRAIAGAVGDPEPEAGSCEPVEPDQDTLDAAGGSRKALVVLSDGGDGNTSAQADRVLNVARAAMVPIIPIIVNTGRGQGWQNLVAAARATGGLVVVTDGVAELDGAFRRVLGFLGATYVLAYRPQAAPGELVAADWHDLRVELPRHPSLNPVYQRGYWR